MKKKLINEPNASRMLWQVFGFTSSARSEEVVHEANKLIDTESNILRVLYRLQDNLLPNELVGAAFMLGECSSGTSDRMLQPQSPDPEAWEFFYHSLDRAHEVADQVNQMLDKGIGVFSVLQELQDDIPTRELLGAALILGSLVEHGRQKENSEENPPHDD